MSMGAVVLEDSVWTVLSPVAVSPLDLEHSLAEFAVLKDSRWLNLNTVCPVFYILFN